MEDPRGPENPYWEEYQRILIKVRSWLDRNKATHAELARLVHVDRTVLTKFLDEYDDFVPTPRRHALTRLMYDLDRACLDQVEIVEIDLNALAAVPEFERWFARHTLCLRQVREDVSSPVLALSELEVWTVPALDARSCLRVGMCANTLLTYVNVVDRPGFELVPRDLLLRSVELVEELRERALGDIDADEDVARELTARIVNYAGFSIAHLGLRIDDSRLVSRGTSDTFGTVNEYERGRFGLWGNARLLLEHLLDADHPEAATAAIVLAEAARSNSNGLFRAALHRLSLPNTRRHWRDNALDVLETR